MEIISQGMFWGKRHVQDQNLKISHYGVILLIFITMYF